MTANSIKSRLSRLAKSSQKKRGAYGPPSANLLMLLAKMETMPKAELEQLASEVSCRKKLRH